GTAEIDRRGPKMRPTFFGRARKRAFFWWSGFSTKDHPKHHFNPAFSLQPWTGSDGLLCEMRRINVRVSARRKHRNATGFEKKLCLTKGLHQDQEKHFEVNLITCRQPSHQTGEQLDQRNLVVSWIPECFEFRTRGAPLVKGFRAATRRKPKQPLCLRP